MKTKTKQLGPKFVKVPQVENKCQWFLLCENPATTTQAHPILGSVAICDRCKARYERM